MSDQPDIILPDEDETALIEMELHDGTITAAHLAATIVAEALDYLYAAGADTGAIDDIHGGASDLLLAAEQLSAALSGAVTVAKTFRTQREEARQALDEFKLAVEGADTTVPEIQQLWSNIEEMAMDWLSYSLFDEWDRLVEELINVTPLTEHEARELTNVLGSEELPLNHALWDTLRDWIAAARQVINEERNT